MRTVPLYEQLGIIIPGAILMVIALFHFPFLGTIIGAEGIEIGGLGVLLLLSYAAGHFLAAIGNVIETVFWRALRGLPTDWVTKSKQGLLSPAQLTILEELVRKQIKSPSFSLEGTERKVWFPISRQCYAAVLAAGRADRLDAFNGNYGLNRGLCAALIVGAVLHISMQPDDRWGTAALVGIAFVFLYRMYRFGVHYARELYIQYLGLPE